MSDAPEIGQTLGSGLSRRRLFGLAGAGTAGVLSGGAASLVLGDPAAGSGESAASDGSDGSGGGRRASGTGHGELTAATAFDGEHQAGIVTPTQDRLHFAAFDHHRGPGDLGALLRDWTAAGRRMTRGEAAGAAVSR